MNNQDPSFDNPHAPSQDPPKPAETGGPMKSLGLGLLALLMVVYIVNPTAGLFEFIPDNIPIIGNLDEATATAILLGCLSYFGIDLPWMRSRKS